MAENIVTKEIINRLAEEIAAAEVNITGTKELGKKVIEQKKDFDEKFLTLSEIEQEKEKWLEFGAAAEKIAETFQKKAEEFNKAEEEASKERLEASNNYREIKNRQTELKTEYKNFKNFVSSSKQEINANVQASSDMRALIESAGNTILPLIDSLNKLKPEEFCQILPKLNDIKTGVDWIANFLYQEQQKKPDDGKDLKVFQELYAQQEKKINSLLILNAVIIVLLLLVVILK